MKQWSPKYEKEKYIAAAPDTTEMIVANVHLTVQRIMARVGAMENANGRKLIRQLTRGSKQIRINGECTSISWVSVLKIGKTFQGKVHKKNCLYPSVFLPYAFILEL